MVSVLFYQGPKGKGFWELALVLPNPPLSREIADEHPPSSMETPDLQVEPMLSLAAPFEGEVQDDESALPVMTGEAELPPIIVWFQTVVHFGLRVKIAGRVRRMVSTGRSPRSIAGRIRRILFYASNWRVTFLHARRIHEFILNKFRREL